MLNRISLAACLLLMLSTVASAQTDSRMMLSEFEGKTWGQTFDQFNFQFESDVKDTDNTASVFFWDSTGRFRLNNSNTDAPRLGYRYLTLDFDTDSETLPNHLDEVSMAFGIHLGEIAGGQLSTMVGMGWSGDNPFADAGGIFGLAHLLWEKPLNATDSLVLSIDWDGAGALLPDIPLPGFAWRHREEKWSVEFGYPRSALGWELMENLRLDAYYAVPYTGDVTLDYSITKRWHLYGEASNFFNGFRQDGEPSTNRVFFEMSRVEAGIRFVQGDFVLKGAYFDMGLSVGYAFNQQFFNGFDVRDIDQTAELTDAPYVGLVIRGKF